MDSRIDSMMASQADSLRRMLTRHTIVCVGCKAGIGRSTLIWNLAHIFSDSFSRLLICHMSPDHLPDIYADRETRRSLRALEQVWRKERELLDVLTESRKEGISLVRMGDIHGEYAPRGQPFPEELREIIGMATHRIEDMHDCILVDLGTASHAQTMGALLESRWVVLVTTPDLSARTSAYALIKHLAARSATCEILVIVNMASSEEQARRIAENLTKTSSSFLGLNIRYLDFIPLDLSVMSAQWKAQPFVKSYPSSSAAQSVRRTAERLKQMVSDKELASVDLGTVALGSAMCETAN